MRDVVVNQDAKVNSLQVSKMGNIPAGNYAPGIMFLIKNITDYPITISIRPAGQNEFVETILYPGWNVELVNAINGVTANTLQYGY